MDVRKRAKKDLNWFEKMLNKIPGFKGYFDREMRRDADKLQREFIVGRLISSKGVINQIIRDETRKKDLSLLTVFDTLLKDLEKTISNIRYADRGYSGFFDLIKIKRENLDLVYETEYALLESVEGFSDMVNRYGADSIDQKKVGEFLKKLNDIKKILEKRSDILMGFDKPGEK